MTAQQDLGDVQPSPARWLGVERSFQQALVLDAVRFLARRLRFADPSWNQPPPSLDSHHGRTPPAAEYVVADTQLIHPHSTRRILHDPSIDPFVAPTGKDQLPLP